MAYTLLYCAIDKPCNFWLLYHTGYGDGLFAAEGTIADHALLQPNPPELADHEFLEAENNDFMVKYELAIHSHFAYFLNTWTTIDTD